jgi:hypothetical protein
VPSSIALLDGKRRQPLPVPLLVCVFDSPPQSGLEEFVSSHFSFCTQCAGSALTGFTTGILLGSLSESISAIGYGRADGLIVACAMSAFMFGMNVAPSSSKDAA